MLLNKKIFLISTVISFMLTNIYICIVNSNYYSLKKYIDDKKEVQELNKDFEKNFLVEYTPMFGNVNEIINEYKNSFDTLKNKNSYLRKQLLNNISIIDTVIILRNNLNNLKIIITEIDNDYAMYYYNNGKFFSYYKLK